MKHKSITSLNNTAWYRTLKVIFIGIFIFLNLFAFGIIYIIQNPGEQLNTRKSFVECNYGNNERLSFKDVGLRNIVDSGEPNIEQNELLLEACDIGRQKVKDLIIARIDTNEDETFADTLLGRMTYDLIHDPATATGALANFAYREGIRLFDLNIRYNNFFDVTIYSALFLAFSIIIFEGIRRTFYYIVTGTFKPTP